MRIVIFGAPGRVGQHIAREAPVRGHQVVGVNRQTAQLAQIDSRLMPSVQAPSPD